MAGPRARLGLMGSAGTSWALTVPPSVRGPARAGAASPKAEAKAAREATQKASWADMVDAHGDAQY
eukprot:11565637-Alexandrium_andersonii.AAC.1